MQSGSTASSPRDVPCPSSRTTILGHVGLPMLTPLMMCWGGMRTTILSVSSSFWVPALTASMGDTSGDGAESGRASRASRATGPDHARPELIGTQAAQQVPVHSRLPVQGSTLPASVLGTPPHVRVPPCHPYLCPPGWG